MTAFYWGILFLVFICLTMVEAMAPLHSQRNKGLTKRWTINALFLITNSYINKSIWWLIGLWVAFESSSGLLAINQSPYISKNIQIFIGILVLDFGHYAFHRIQHQLPFFWRFHKVHHGQRHLDLSSGWLFHPGEALFSSVFTIFLIYLFNVPAESLLLFSIAATIFNMLEHGNYHLPHKIDRIFSIVFITPGLHRAHHSLSKSEFNLNFGLLFSVWDRLLGSFGYAKNESKLPEEYGIDELEEEKSENPLVLLRLPFLSTMAPDHQKERP